MPAMAAAVLVALTTGIFIGRGLDMGPADQTAQPVQHYAMAGTVEAAEREYQAAFRELVPLDYSGLRLEGEEPDARDDRHEVRHPAKPPPPRWRHGTAAADHTARDAVPELVVVGHAINSAEQGIRRTSRARRTRSTRRRSRSRARGVV